MHTRALFKSHGPMLCIPLSLSRFCNTRIMLLSLQHIPIHCNTLQHTATHVNQVAFSFARSRSRHWMIISVQCVAACCSVLQRVAVRFSVLQCVAMHCSVLQCIGMCCSVLQCVAVCCSVLQCVAVCCSVAVVRALSL